MKSIASSLLIWLGILASGAAHDLTRPKEHAHDGGPCAPDADAVCHLKIALKDADTGEPIPGMIRLLDENDDAVAIPELLDRCVGLPRDARKLGWHVLIGPATISAPQSKVTVEAVSGLERTAASRALDLSGKTEASAELELKRFWNAAERGLVSGNTHLHLKDLSRAEADRYLQEVPRADGLDIVFVSYLERALVDRTYITNEHSREDLEALSTDMLRFGNGEEYRHNFGGGGEGYGHMMFLDLPKLIKPASVGPGITKRGSNGVPLRPGIEDAREQGATVVWCHNGFGYEDVPSWTAGLVHAQNIFDGGNRGSYEETYYRYLNVGMRVPFSTGTDWFIYDFSRVYADLSGAKPTVESWLAALRAGRTMISNGPLLEFKVNEKRPGDVLEDPGEIEVWCRVVCRKDPGELELILNGEVISLDSQSVGESWRGGFAKFGGAKLSIREPSWIAVRISPDSEATNEFGRKLFAHTSPVYIDVDGKSVFNPETARGIVAEIEGDLKAIEAAAEFASEADRERIRAIYQEAVAEWERRIARASE